jgi:opacity protein-like surface antigen
VRGPYPEAAPFEFTLASGWAQVAGNPCAGGGADAAYRVAPEWQIALAVNGCKMLGMANNTSGDALVFQVGPRWNPAPAGKWSPYAHLLFGGRKLTEEVMDPAKKRAVLEANKDLDPALDYTLHGQYTSFAESSAFAFTAGVGLNYKINSALAVRVANFEYLVSGKQNLGGVPFNNGFQMSTGMVLRLGTW